MTQTRRNLCWFAVVLVALVLGGLAGWRLRHHSAPEASMESAAGTPAATTVADRPSAADLAPTLMYAHNLRLRRGPNFRIYIDWVAGQTQRTHREVNPSLDDPDTFVLQIEKGVIHVNIGDVANYLNTALPKDAPLHNVSIEPYGEQVKIHGTLHKVISLPVEIVGALSPTAGGDVRLHVVKLSVLKVPMKGLLGSMHIEISDLLHSTNVLGVRIADNDLIFNTEKLLPPPHIHGVLTAIRVTPPDLEIIYGNAPHDAQDQQQLSQWHNFLRFQNGALDFGKLTMHNADITMIDATQEPWFDLDLVNYEAQVVNGFTRMTAQAGLEIYMPSLKGKSPAKLNQKVTLDWLKNRNTPIPVRMPKQP